MQPFDTKAMQFVYQARLELAANNRRGFGIVKPANTNNFFRKLWKTITEPNSRVETNRKFGKKSIS
ncbi:hypothetical protein [Alicyclobacillus fodiniaquatilis]|uniref:Uncharacterized protein n=1 Tax=Alicyclobacillus fodiniaquatilis TaxID=1661150 RepID=A0ABW4JHU4_9BACL